MFTGLKVYIAGKITGFDEYQERFAEAEKRLREEGALPMNPAVLPPGYTWGEYMHICFSMIDVCDAVYFLDNFADSAGAMKEFNYAATKNKLLLYENIDPVWKENKA
jgi:hypothetical protein